MNIFRDVFGKQLTVRRWVAWKLVQLAWHIFMPEREESIRIIDAAGRTVAEWEIVGDVYGCGISSQIVTDELPDGWTIETDPWDEFHANSVDITEWFRDD